VIRVGFVFTSDGSWLGEISYFRNLLTAVYALSDRKIEPVLLTAMHMPAERFHDFPPVEVVRSQLFDRYALPWTVRKVWHRSFGHDLLLERLLVKHRIAVLSHSGQLGVRACIPTIGWISDFQHRRMPEFFSAPELKRRERGFAKILTCSRVIISSLDAQADLSNFYPTYAERSRVLQFVADVDTRITCPSLDEIKEKYAIKTAYFHLPNQFWIHKNHYVVISALRILKERGERVAVLATGNRSDYRWSDHFQSLMAHIEECGVANEFRVIGVVPYPDLIALMKHSVGLINPSFFEGWSTTVEESKALGKRIILSDIRVHREQSPMRGVYFNPHDPEALAVAMKQQLDLWSAEEDAECVAQAIAALPTRREDFARKYQEVVLELC
jgi:glycosyltransferase involved in cell wall biosynthesis